jgi:hypothetical protein
VARGKAVGVEVGVDVPQAQRHRLADQLAEDAAATGQVADLAPDLLVDADVDEAFEFAPAGVEDAERGIAGAGQLPRRIDHRPQHRLDVELGEEAVADVDEPAKAQPQCWSRPATARAMRSPRGVSVYSVWGGRPGTRCRSTTPAASSCSSRSERVVGETPGRDWRNSLKRAAPLEQA